MWHLEGVDDVIKRILETAIYAPSGDNMQPWRFEVSGNTISIFNIPERDQILYNFEQRGSLIAHGALIENITLAALHEGYTTYVNLFPDKMNIDLTAKIQLEKSVVSENELYTVITHRCTNRKPYSAILLTEDQKDKLLRLKEDFPGFDLKLVESIDEKKKLAETISTNEIILLENRTLHDMFFKQIVWSEKEERKKKSGLYLKTLELPPPARIIFRLLRWWKIAQFLGRLGIPKKVASENAKVYSAAAAIGAIVMPDEGDATYIFCGRLFQRIWLQATAMGLSMQPLAGIIYLHRVAKKRAISGFSDYHLKLIWNAYSSIIKSSAVDSGILAMVFRIGIANKPSAYSSRRLPEIQYDHPI
ncbi:MAG: hypothetical protein G01um101466_421 [Parcubacteria group bacterium Gr01-1014_66]|nr:MAG: hypothetical protein G01um101466_421 [Parcubacteria group bacterium Gr01-1014_66]